MSIASDTVAYFRTEWADRLVDSCVFAPRVLGGLDTTTGVHPTSGTPTYSGPCLVRPQSAASVVAGEELIEQRGYLVVLPWDAVGVGIDDIGTVTSTFDGVLNTKQVVVRNVRADTYNTARKLDCEDNQGG